MEKGSHRRLEEISQVIRSNLPAAVAMSYLPSHFALIYISELDIGLHGFIFEPIKHFQYRPSLVKKHGCRVDL